MNDDPGEVDVLYAKIEPLDDNNPIQIIADQLLSRFVDSGLSKKHSIESSCMRQLCIVFWDKRRVVRM